MRTLLLTHPLHPHGRCGAGAGAAEFPDHELRQRPGADPAEGGVVIGSGPNIFDRFVSSTRYCMGGETYDYTWVRTRDVPQCPVYRCKEIEEWMR